MAPPKTRGSVLEFEGADAFGLPWSPLDDVVMGGVSLSGFQMRAFGGEPAALIFRGTVTSENNGGFASIRTSPLETPLDWSSAEGVAIRFLGDGQRYKLILRTEGGWDTVCFCKSFDATAGDDSGWRTLRIPFSDFFPVFRAKTVPERGRPELRTVFSIQLMLSKFEYDGELNPSWGEGPFELPITLLAPYYKGDTADYKQ